MTTDRFDPSELRARFRELHSGGLFVMPNAWDVASARVMAAAGLDAVATTSSGFAATLGRDDYEIVADELLEHAALLARSAGVPLNVDSERCFGSGPAEVADFVSALGDTGAAGCSIEDYDPSTERIDDTDSAAERVAAAAEATKRHGMLLTARAERHLYEPDAPIDDTLTRLQRFADAGADVLYAPGLSDPDDFVAVCALGLPVNALVSPATPAVGDLADLGVRRVSTGGALLRVALGEVKRAVEELNGPGTLDYMNRSLRGAEFAHILLD